MESWGKATISAEGRATYGSRFRLDGRAPIVYDVWIVEIPTWMDV